MGKEDDNWRDRQEKRREEDTDQRARDKARGKVSRTGREEIRESLAGATTEKLTELMDKADPMIDRLNSLYNQYFSGVEKRPPIEPRQLLDQTMFTLQLIPKPTASYQFKYNAILQKHTTFTSRWDKRLREIEAGKVKLKLGGGDGKKKIGSF